MLPDSSAADTLESGVGERLEAGVECQVLPEGDAFDVHARIEQPMLRDFRLIGVVREEASALSLEVSFADDEPLQADCDAQVQTVVPGALWIRKLSCPAPCGVVGGLIVEQCAH
jgi:hypothetical protein